MTTAITDHAALMQANLVRVFGERDPARRLKAIAEIYADDAVLYEPHASATGHAAINQAVETLLSSLPPSFGFTAIGPAVGHHGLGRLRWQSGPPNGPVAVTGTDVAHIEDGRIQTLHVFLDPTGAFAVVRGIEHLFLPALGSLRWLTECTGGVKQGRSEGTASNDDRVTDIATRGRLR